MASEPKPTVEPVEPEHYEVPPKLTLKDSLGVVVALIALLVIGVLGYVWLTPGMSLGKVFGQQPATDATAQIPAAQPPAKTPASSSQAQAKGETTSTGPAAKASALAAQEPTAAAEAAPAASPAPAHVVCDFCGMFADESASYIMATWAGGKMNHFDSWNCAFSFAKEKALKLASAEVSRFGGKIGQPDWLNAEKAWYLYKTAKPVKGSMPPYVAAFSTKEAAEAGQGELGGEVVDFATLRSKWQ